VEVLQESNLLDSKRLYNYVETKQYAIICDVARNQPQLFAVRKNEEMIKLDGKRNRTTYQIKRQGKVLPALN
jgi:phage terminase large subunit